MAIVDYLQNLMEASPLSKSYFEQRFKSTPEYEQINRDAQKVYTDKLQVMINNEKAKLTTINFLKHVGFSKGDMSKTADLIHDIISELTLTVYMQKFMEMMKNNESTVEPIKNLYDSMSAEKKKVQGDNDAWKIVENSYMMLPDQEQIVIKNYNGTGETKTISIDNDARWYIGTAIPEEDLKKSPLYATLDSSQKNALISASKRGEMAVRRACPLDAKRSGHCGAVPYVEAYKNSIFVMLKHSKKDKSVASVFVDDEGNVIESKAPHNQSVIEKYHMNVVWLMNHEWISGTAWGGYAADRNFFFYKLKDKDLANHFYDHSGKNVTEVDREINDMRQKYQNGEISIDQLISMVGPS